MAARTVTMQQVLHGYKDGHRVLGASCGLTTESARQMLVLSDLAGPGFVPHFDGYLSGYPLPDDHYYCLSRTWYAPEMPRPGCVFTHTLLIDFAELAAISDLRPLLHLFRRPQTQKAWSTYREIIEVTLGEAVDLPDEVRREDAESMLASLYGYPEQPILCEAASANRYEATTLGILSQQWPRLRRSFSFCLGATAARYLGSRPLDLLCTPTHSSTQTSRELPNAVWARGANPPTPWSMALLADICEHSGGLRRFLWTYGADVLRPRSAMIPLVEEYLIRQRTGEKGTRITAELERIGGAFPAANDALRLKRDILELGGNGLAETKRILKVATTPYESAFTNLLPRLEERLSQLLREQRDIALSLLVEMLHADCNQIGKELRTLIISLLTLDDLITIGKSKQDVVSGLALLVPEAALQPQLLQGSADYQREILRSIARREVPISDSTLHHLMRALTNPAAGVAAVLVDGFGQRSLNTLLSIWAHEEPPTMEARRAWESALRMNTEMVVGWLLDAQVVPGEALSWLLTLLDPLSTILREQPLEWALRSFHQVAARSASDGRTVAATFFFTLALVHSSMDAAELASSSFSWVHEAAARYAFPADAAAVWQRLEGILPSLGYLRNWDRCERLRRAFVLPFLRGHFSPRWFLSALEDPKLLRHVVESSLKLEGGSTFLRSLTERMDEEQWSITPEQRRIIRAEIRRR